MGFDEIIFVNLQIEMAKIGEGEFGGGYDYRSKPFMIMIFRVCCCANEIVDRTS